MFFSYCPEVAIPDIRVFEIQPGDIIFLCSDGVNKYIQPEKLIACLFEPHDTKQIAETIKKICNKDSLDNYTGIVIQIKE